VLAGEARSPHLRARFLAAGAEAAELLFALALELEVEVVVAGL